MAVIGSSAGGYATVTPLQGNPIGEALQINDQNAQRYRDQLEKASEKKIAAAKAKQDALAKQAEQDLDDSDKINAIRAKDSGISGIQSAVVNGMADQRQKWIEATQNYRKTGDKKYLIERSSAMNNLNAIANIPESYKTATEGIYEGVRSGTLDRSEEKRITDLGEKIDKGFIVPKIENGVMSFDVFERDPNTGQLSSIAIKNRKGEDILSDLTPHKKFDYNKHIGEVQKLAGPPVPNVVGNETITEVPNVDKYARNEAEKLLKNKDLFHDVAQQYGIDEEPNGEYSPENIKLVQDEYENKILSGFSRGVVPYYGAEREARAQEAANRARIKAKKEEGTFEPPVKVVTRSGENTNYGMNITKGEKVLIPTYEKGKDGPIRGAVIRDDGSYSFSIAMRKNDDLNPIGRANKKEFESNPENTGTEYVPTDSDYVYSATKPTEFNTRENMEVIEPLIRGMVNPRTGQYFQNFEQYETVYSPYKTKTKKTAKPKQQYKNPIEQLTDTNRSFPSQSTKKAPEKPAAQKPKQKTIEGF